MLNAIGTPAFTRYATKIYGRPDMEYKLQGMSAVDGAFLFLNETFPHSI
ncbi:MAG: flavohemoglobin expression-modulating QEGLA motif protein [Cyclobacteriaceae bacterium]|nr:flavohemoglobin expression-modulating QEGLA motif protein [Cyclobacteriaceae bacterium]